MTDKLYKFVVIEYEEPITPWNFHLYEPVQGLGHIEFEASINEMMEYFNKLGGPRSPFRVVTHQFAIKHRLINELQSET